MELSTTGRTRSFAFRTQVIIEKQVPWVHSEKTGLGLGATVPRQPNCDHAVYIPSIFGIFYVFNAALKKYLVLCCVLLGLEL